MIAYVKRTDGNGKSFISKYASIERAIIVAGQMNRQVAADRRKGWSAKSVYVAMTQAEYKAWWEEQNLQPAEV